MTGDDKLVKDCQGYALGSNCACKSQSDCSAAHTPRPVKLKCSRVHPNCRYETESLGKMQEHLIKHIEEKFKTDA